MKAFRFMKYSKEYRAELFRMPTFWIGVGFIVLGIIVLQVIQIHWVVPLVLMLMGFSMVVAAKQRILGRLEERHFKK